MRVAIADWNGTVSPVFDTARTVLVADIENGRARAPHTEALGCERDRVERLRQLGVDLLICGAITRELADRVAAQGLALVPFVGGDVQAVLKAYAEGMPLADYVMPGCRRGRGGGGKGAGRRMSCRRRGAGTGPRSRPHTTRNDKEYDHAKSRSNRTHG
jgi:predicted Fe-Mo cluster-binding NifX family protein